MLLGISGSLRKEATNRKLVREAARLFGGDYTEADLALPLYDGDLERDDGIPGKVIDLVDQIAAADAVVIASPEYNGSLSGVLKNALDWVSRTDGNPWLNKPVAVMSAAAGRSGGARGAWSVRLAMTAFRPRFSSGPEVLVAASSQQFDAEGRLINEMNLKALTEAMQTLRAEVSEMS